MPVILLYGIVEQLLPDRFFTGSFRKYSNLDFRIRKTDHFYQSAASSPKIVIQNKHKMRFFKLRE